MVEKLKITKFCLKSFMAGMSAFTGVQRVGSVLKGYFLNSKKHLLLGLVMLNFWSQPTFSSDFEMMIEFGSAYMNIKDNYAPISSAETFGTSIGITANYKIQSNYIFSLSASGYAKNEFNRPETIQVSELCTGLGYSLYDKDFRLIPMALYCSWELDYREINDPALKPNTIRGGDMIAKVYFEKTINERAAYVGSATFGSYNFGSVLNFMAGFRINIF